jgi:predicted phage terminase large subunit-like protein
MPVNVFMGVDPASSVRKTADYSVIMPVAVDEQNNRYILQYYRNRATPMQLAESIIEYFKLFKPVKVRVESVGYQEMLREYLRQRCDEEKIFISGLEIKENPRTSKSSRLETMQPYFAQKKVYILETMEELKDELLLYPRGKHDDLLDGLYYATKKCFPPIHQETEIKNKKVVDDTYIDDISWKVA